MSRESLLRFIRGANGRTTRLLSGVIAVAGIGVAAVAPSSCQSGGIGDPCTPEDEYLGTFGGFQVSQENIESRAFQCESRICLVNHFQGRVSCPLGQPAKTPCNNPGEACGGGDGDCVESAVFAPDCTADTAKGCKSGKCADAGFCICESNDDCPTGHICDGDTQQCRLFVCHVANNCQDSAKDAATNDGKDCCIPGTDTPVAAEVCGQCAAEGLRDAANAVYCSCRCGVAEGQPEDENFNFCECPDGFQCAEVRPDVGLGDKQLTGKYCVKNGDPIVVDGKEDPSAAALQCGDLVGHKGGSGTCAGTAVAGGD